MSQLSVTADSDLPVLTDSAAEGWDPAGLARVLEFAKGSGSAQLMLLTPRGVLLRTEIDAAPVDVYAVQKGLVTVLLGLAQEKGFLEIWDHLNHHLAPEWTQLSPWDEAKLGIETVLTMTTGMDDDLALKGDIGTTWRYNNVAYQHLKRLLETATGQSLGELTAEWLARPLGMRQTCWVSREHIVAGGLNVTGLLSTAEDLARFGLMILQRGRFGDTRVLVEDFYLDDMLRPGSAENPAWAWSWWLNNQSHYRHPGRDDVRDGVIIPTAPRDLFAARGLGDNHLAIVPSLGLVVARTCNWQPGDKPSAFEQDFWSLLMQARLA